MRILRNTFELPGSIWPPFAGGTGLGIYLDGFGSSVQVDSNLFVLGPTEHLMMFINGGRDSSFTRNVVRPLNDTMQRVVGEGPVVQVNNKGCGSTAACDFCMRQSPGFMGSGLLIQAEFLKRVPFNSSAVWKRRFPKLASMFQDKPCQAAGNLVADNVVCYPPALIKVRRSRVVLFTAVLLTLILIESYRPSLLARASATRARRRRRSTRRSTRWRATTASTRRSARSRGN